MSQTITGVVKCYRIAQHRRSKYLLENLLLDALNPLPAYEIWCILTDEPSRHREHNLQYQLKSKRRPKAISPDMEDKKITFTSGVTMWSNGLGGYLTRVSNVHLAD